MNWTTKEFYIPCDGIRLHAKLDMPEDAVSCPLVIIIHGFSGHMEERHITAVSQAVNGVGFASLRAEMYGHGKSDGEFRNHTLLKWITCGLAVVDYARELPFVSDLYLCGHSQGGLLTMLLAGMCPDWFKAIIPLSPAWMIPEHLRAGEMLRYRFDPLHVPQVLDRGDEKVLNGHYARVGQLLHPEEVIGRYAGPVLIVQGDADEAVPVEYAKKAAAMYRNCKLVLIPGDTHCYDYHLEMVTEAVADFLK